MPFTLAHPAAAIVLRRPLGKLGVTAALVAGSLVPDLPYFLPLGVEPSLSHSLGGLFLFCLPAGLIAYVLFYRLIAPLGGILSSPAVARRLPAHWADGIVPKRRTLAVLTSLLAGSLRRVQVFLGGAVFAGGSTALFCLLLAGALRRLRSKPSAFTADRARGVSEPGRR